MVDGADIGAGFEYTWKGTECSREEFFRTAELVCVEVGEHTHKETPKDKGVIVNRIYAVYDGNKIVTSYLSKEDREAFFEMHSEKMVMCMKKPYILNGESSTPLTSYWIWRDGRATRRPTNARISIQATPEILLQSQNGQPVNRGTRGNPGRSFISQWAR